MLKETDNKTQKNGAAEDILKKWKGRKKQGKRYILLARNGSWLMSIELVLVICLCYDGRKPHVLEEKYTW